ncbi:MAG: response regulator [Pseudomonadota bacterium]
MQNPSNLRQREARVRAMQDSHHTPSPAAARAPLRVVIADDNADLSVAMSHVIDAEPDMRCVGRVDAASRVVEFTRETDADGLLLDLRLRDGTGMDVIETLTAELPALRVIVFSGYPHPELAQEARRRGAAGFVTKSGDLDELLDEIRHVAASGRA